MKMKMVKRLAALALCLMVGLSAAFPLMGAAYFFRKGQDALSPASRAGSGSSGPALPVAPEKESGAARPSPIFSAAHR